MAVTELAPEPPLPRGERIELPGRGTTFVRTVAGPPGRTHGACSSTAGSPAAG